MCFPVGNLSRVRVRALTAVHTGFAGGRRGRRRGGMGSISGRPVGFPTMLCWSEEGRGYIVR